MVQSDAAEDNAVFKRKIWRILRIVYYVRNNSAWLEYQRGRLGTTFSSLSMAISIIILEKESLGFLVDSVDGVASQSYSRNFS